MLCLFSYDICIRGEEGYCCTQFMPCADTNSYTLDAAEDDAIAESGTVCTNDYIDIEGKNS